MRLLGAILAGGEARRFGSDKALALLDGVTLIEHAAAMLRNICDEIVVCGRAVAPAGMATIADQPAPGLGPLGGICGSLRHAAAIRCDAVLTIGCDTPALPALLLETLIATGGARYVRQMPIVGYWPVALADLLAHHLAAAGDRSVRGWGAVVGATVLDSEADIANINRPSDLAAWVASRGP